MSKFYFSLLFLRFKISCQLLYDSVPFHIFLLRSLLGRFLLQLLLKLHEVLEKLCSIPPKQLILRLKLKRRVIYWVLLVWCNHMTACKMIQILLVLKLILLQLKRSCNHFLILWKESFVELDLRNFSL